VALLCSAFLFSFIFISVELYSRLIAILLECCYVFFKPLEPEAGKAGSTSEAPKPSKRGSSRRFVSDPSPRRSCSSPKDATKQSNGKRKRDKGKSNPKYTRALPFPSLPFRDSITVTPFLLHEVIIGLILGDG